MEFALKSEIYFIHLHSLLRTVFVHNIYYINFWLTYRWQVRPRFMNKTLYIADIEADTPPANFTERNTEV